MTDFFQHFLLFGWGFSLTRSPCQVTFLSMTTSETEIKSSNFSLAMFVLIQGMTESLVFYTKRTGSVLRRMEQIRPRIGPPTEEEWKKRDHDGTMMIRFYVKRDFAELWLIKRRLRHPSIRSNVYWNGNLVCTLHIYSSEMHGLKDFIQWNHIDS